MYPKEFQNLVENAVKYSKEYYKNKDIQTENPFYIGFGNPNSDILIVGQEKAIPKDSQNQIISESIENPFQWNKIIENNITDINYRFYESRHFKNPLHPYDGKPKNGNTWNQYQKLIQLVYPELSELELHNSFLLKTFITEINHEVSTRSLGNQRNNERVNFTNHKFYNSFPVTILAIGNYLSRKEIESIYNVEFYEDISENHRKLAFYKNDSQKRTLIQTRQMSNFYFNGERKREYFQRIAEKIKKARHANKG